MSVKAEIKSLRRIQGKISHGGRIAPFIRSTKNLSQKELSVNK